MLYFYLFFLLFFLGAITINFIRSLKSSTIPPNAKLIIDAWNSVSLPEKTCQINSVTTGTDCPTRNPTEPSPLQSHAIFTEKRLVYPYCK